MRILRARIEGFRCLDDVEVHFGNTTRIIGPNGVGKSSVLRALDWFFNGGTLDESDICVRSTLARVRVEVEFGNLTDRDRNALGRYAPTSATTIVLWKTLQDGRATVSGNARTYPPFGPIREASAAMEKRRLYKELRESSPELNLPLATTAPGVDEALTAWESANPSLLVDAEESTTTEFFGFLGAAKLSGIFDFVFVSADLRASEEAESRRGALIGKLLQRSIDQAVITSKINALIDDFDIAQQKVVRDGLAQQLDDLGRRLTQSVGAFAGERVIELSAEVPTPRRGALEFGTRISDGDAHTLVAGQGHGFQRALLLGVLKLISEDAQDEATSGTVLLAIEEPELFQHPAQARSFARVLRKLGDDSASGMQVAYATHSPLFIEPGRFEEIRRLHRTATLATKVLAASSATVHTRLQQFMNVDDVQKQIDRVCPRQLAEAVFADTVVLVEGETDQSFIAALLERFRPDLLSRNLAVVEVSGKQGLPLADAVLSALGIQTLIIADNDEDKRSTDLAKATEKDQQRHASAVSSNHRLLRSVGEQAEDWPSGLYSGRVLFLRPCLEDFLAREWPEWEAKRVELVASGEGFEGKHAMTYTNATLDSDGTPPLDLLRVFDERLDSSNEPISTEGD